MERVLNGKPRRAGMAPSDEPAGDGGDSPAWSRKRGAYEPPDVEQRAAFGRCPYAELHAHSAFSFLDGASTPEELVEEAVRLGLRRHRAHRPRRLLRGGAVRRGGQGAGHAHRLRGRAVAGRRRPHRGRPIRRGPHLLVLARGPEGYRRLSRQIAAAHLAGGEKGKLLYDFDALAEAAGGHWHILTGCRKGHVRQALSEGGPEAAGAGAGRPGRPVRRATGSASSSPITAIRSTTSATPCWPRWRRSSVSASSPPPARTTPHRHAAGWPWRWRAVRARQLLDEAAGWLAPPGGAHLRSGDGDGAPVRALPEVGDGARPISASSARSTCS